MTLAVIYIARGAGAGLPAVEAFLDAYQRYPSGYPHRLVVATKGWEGVSGLPDVIARLREIGADTVTLPDDGYDWGAYMRIIPDLKEDWLCLLNTHSRPLVENWLALLRQPASTPGVGAVGATGSWGSMSVTWPLFESNFSRLALYPARLVLGVFRLCCNLGSFPSFPNPHLRSNAILMSRELFMSFCSNHDIPRSKRDAHILESGRTGLTAYLNSLGLRVQVAGADGGVYDPETWIKGGTFRVPGQPNLLVSDNQTRYYQQANNLLKRRLENAAWGVALTNLSNSQKTLKTPPSENISS